MGVLRARFTQMVTDCEKALNASSSEARRKSAALDMRCSLEGLKPFSIQTESTAGEPQMPYLFTNGHCFEIELVA